MSAQKTIRRRADELHKEHTAIKYLQEITMQTNHKLNLKRVGLGRKLDMLKNVLGESPTSTNVSTIFTQHKRNTLLRFREN